MANDSADNHAKHSLKESEEGSSEIAKRQGVSGLAGTILLVLLLAVILAWIRFAPNKQVTEETDPSTKQETETSVQTKEEDLRDSQINNALDNFLGVNYKGWQKQGKSYDDRASDEERLQIFDVHLVSNDKNQVVKVFVEKFQKDDDSEYWFAYQPNDMQMLGLKTRSSAKESTGDKSLVGADESASNH